MSIKSIIGLVLAYCLTLTAFAQQIQSSQALFETEASLLKHLNEVQYDRSSLNKSSSETYQAYINLSRENKWSLALLHAEILKLEIDGLFGLQEFSATRIEALKNRALAQDLRNFLIRLELIELRSFSKYSNIQKTLQKQSSIQRKASMVEDPKLAGMMYSDLAQSFFEMSDYANALKSANNAFEQYEFANDTYGQGTILNLLANINIELKDYEQAINYHTLAGDIAKQLGNLHAYSISLHNLGKTYLKNKQYEPAKENFERAIEISVQLNNPNGIAFSQQALGKIAVDQQNWQRAINLFESSRQHFIEVNNTISHMYDNLGLIESYTAMNNLVRAKALIDEYEALNKQLERKYKEAFFRDLVAEFEYVSGNFETAYLISKENNKLKQNLSEQRDSEELEKYKRQFETTLIQKENEALQIQSKLNALQLANQKRQNMLLLFGGASMIAIFSYLLFIKIKHSKRYERLASIDTLTGAKNRRFIMQYAQSFYSKAKQEKRPFMLALVDLDKFKAVNDNFGHTAGDLVLKAFANACNKCLRDNDKFGRYGGEEWMFAFDVNDKKVIIQIFERLREALNKENIAEIPNDYLITFSMGVAIYDPDSNQKLEDLINQADQMLYIAKDQGRNQVVF